MIRIVAGLYPLAAPDMRIADIPVGQVFRGRIKSLTRNTSYPGVFYKAQGGWTHKLSGIGHDACIVRLDSAGSAQAMDGQRGANVFIRSQWVADYEPLVATVTLTPRA